VRRRLGVLIWKFRAPAREAEAKRVAALIPQLGSPQYEDRARAARELEAVGRNALSQLYGATLSPDPEIARRADAVIANILRGGGKNVAAS
jgi:hypothetical protein